MGGVTRLVEALFEQAIAVGAWQSALFSAPRDEQRLNALYRKALDAKSLIGPIIREIRKGN